MDLIYTDANMKDLGTLLDFKMDLAFGIDENNFELSVSNTNHVCESGSVVYIEDTEYGGIVDGIRVETAGKKIIYMGNTWHGLLDSKIIEPLKETDADSGDVIVTCGKNLIPYPYYDTTKTVNGITFTVKDGGIVANGTATNTATFIFSHRTDGKMILGPGEYKVTGCPSGGSDSTYRLIIAKTLDSGTYGTVNIEYGAGATFTLTEDTDVYVAFTVINGASVSNLVVKPMVRLASDTSNTWKLYKENPIGEYLILSGEANAVLQWLIERMELSNLFKASEEKSGIYISEYKMDRYIEGYSGMKKMLATVNGKLKMTYQEGKVVLSAEKLIDYSKDDEFDSDQIDFVIEKNFKPINHIICLGKGELKDRTVIHLYTDEVGNISHSQSIFGIDERVATFDNPNAESEEELEKGGIERLQAAWSEGKLQLDLDATTSYDIGDIVGAKELVTGASMQRPIVKKIVTIEKNTVKITHKVGE